MEIGRRQMRDIIQEDWVFQIYSCFHFGHPQEIPQPTEFMLTFSHYCQY